MNLFIDTWWYKAIMGKEEREPTWENKCVRCGKSFKDHNTQDLHDCELTGDENQRGLVDWGK